MRRHQTADKTVLITGPARGVGAETARQLARKGARLSLVGIEPERLERLAAELGPETAWFEADVRDVNQLRVAVSGTVKRFGGIDVVVANAGVVDVEPLTEIEASSFQRALDINLLGVWHTIAETAPELARRRGYILTVASMVAGVHLPYLATYNASKAGVNAFAQGIRLELKAEGVELGVAYFSLIDTDFVRDVERAEAGVALTDLLPRTGLKPLKPQRVAAAVVRGIERRSRRVVVPWYFNPVQLAPGLFQPLIDASLARLLPTRGGVPQPQSPRNDSRVHAVEPDLIRR